MSLNLKAYQGMSEASRLLRQSATMSSENGGIEGLKRMIGKVITSNLKLAAEAGRVSYAQGAPSKKGAAPAARPAATPAGASVSLRQTPTHLKRSRKLKEDKTQVSYKDLKARAKFLGKKYKYSENKQKIKPGEAAVLATKIAGQKKFELWKPNKNKDGKFAGKYTFGGVSETNPLAPEKKEVKKEVKPEKPAQPAKPAKPAEPVQPAPDDPPGTPGTPGTPPAPATPAAATTPQPGTTPPKQAEADTPQPGTATPATPAADATPAPTPSEE